MSKGPQLTDYQSEKVKRLVLDCIIMHCSIDDTIDYVQKILNLKLAYDTMAHIRSSLKRDAKKEFERLRQDRFEYQYQFMQRIVEIENLQRKQWQIYNENSQKPLIQLNCLKELHALTITLANLYDLVPAISRLGGTGEGDIFTGKARNIMTAANYDPKNDPNRKF